MKKENQETQVGEPLLIPDRLAPLCLTPDNIRKLKADEVFRMGLSVGNRIPVRVLAYPVLALELLRANPNTKLEIYVATEFSWLNRIDSVVAEENKRKIQSWTRAFIKRFIPEISSRVQFIPTFELTPERTAILDELATAIKFNPEIYAFCRDRNGDDSLRYIAAHSLYMRDPLPISDTSFLTPPSSNASGSPVMIGGPQEKLTRIARSLIRQYFGGNEIGSRDISTSVGRVPPYYESRTYREPYLSQAESVTPDFLLREKTIPELYQDLATLLAFLNGASYEDVWSKGSAKIKRREQFVQNTSLTELNDFLNLENTFEQEI